MGFSRKAPAGRHGSYKQGGAAEPLLQRTGWPSDDHQVHSSTPQKPVPVQASVDLGWQFICRLCRLLQAVNAAPAASLLVLSILEAIIVSKIGTISGIFYQVFVDGQQSEVLHLMLWSSGCYAATALFYTLKVSLQDFFAWRWRASLTCRLQQTYCSNNAFYTLKGVDNPDQRLAQDLPLLTTTLAETLSVLAAAPFNVFWYTRLTYQVFGSWCPVAAAYAFFLAGAVLQRVVMLPVARGVFQQEAAEGSFRYNQVRIRTAAQEIAMYRSAPLEHQHMVQQLSVVLACQGRLLLRRAVLTSVTKVLEYGGLIVNFGCLAAAVFGGAWASERATAGGIAAKVSVASFYLLTLIYSFTQVLDLAAKVSNLAGLTARVSQLWEEVNQHQQQPHNKVQQLQQQQQHSVHSPCKHLPQHQHQQHAARTSHELEYQQQQEQQHQSSGYWHPQALHLLDDHGAAFSHKRYASQAVMLQPPQLIIVAAATGAACHDGAASSSQQQQQQQQGGAGQLLIDLGIEPGGPAVDISNTNQQQQQATGHLMQVSIHSLGSDVLLHEVRRAFPDSPRLAPLTAVVTFQFCGQAQQVMMQQYQQQQQSTGQLLGPAAAAGDGSSFAAGRSSSSSSSSSSGGGSAADCVCSECAMSRMLAVFLIWQRQVQDYITNRGYWCDAVDPRSGHALHGAAGCGYDEVIGAQVMLGYDRQQQGGGGGCPLVSHPLAGTQVYPATLFTSAPLPVLKEALKAAAGRGSSSSSRATSAAEMAVDLLLGSAASTSQQYGAVAAVEGPSSPVGAKPSSSSSGPGRQQACVTPAPGRALAATAAADQVWPQLHLLICHNLTASTPSGVIIVDSLTLCLTAQGFSIGVASLLIQGPSGCGKSTLLRCLAGLWQADAGSFSIAGAVGGHSAPPAVAAASSGREPAGCLTMPGIVSTDADQRPCVMFVPQKLLTAPGHTLRDQLAYPAASTAWACCCQQRNHSSSSSRRRRWVEQHLRKSRHSSVQTILMYCGSSSNQRGRLTPDDCVLSINHQQHTQQVQQIHGLSWWGNWLTCGVLRQQLQHTQQAVLYEHIDRSKACSPSYQGAPHGQPTTVGHINTLQQQQWQQQAVSTGGPNLCPSCQRLLTVLQQVGLSYLLGSLAAGLDTAVDDWSSVLSPGEMQRLAFARVLLHRPLLAVLDEATSSLPDSVSVELYHQLQQAGVNYLSVGHSSSLETVHDQVLHIFGDGSGSWRLHAAAH